MDEFVRLLVYCCVRRLLVGRLLGRRLANWLVSGWVSRRLFGWVGGLLGSWLSGWFERFASWLLD